MAFKRFPFIYPAMSRTFKPHLPTKNKKKKPPDNDDDTIIVPISSQSVIISLTYRPTCNIYYILLYCKSYTSRPIHSSIICTWVPM